MEVEDVISYSLIVGVVVSILLIIIGVVLIFVHDGAQGFTLEQIGNVHSFINTSTTTPEKVVQGVQKLDGLSFVYLGLIVLIATPIIRVILLIGDFLKNRDLLYTILSLIVLINILIAIFI
ncbi:MAG: DUF1634 domain-containing protein, partial [Metallosphaera sp.]